ncbi:hypothetical protein AQJ27_35995 [Streptomyces olivochromogenes]|uniref:Oxidoreductase n=1 Tax=Streptomyces olivochromogenes TaxID=1963 RepID=A0A250VRN4_STROL|nr:hypothetical protein AQJ27_35995 [Streptomyces olivochromogenes]GAX56630.1 oxidoreductase [Streptomyces olivochromogenes]
MSAESARTVALPSGEEIAALGQGTWYLGQDPARREQEIAALRLGVDLGMTVVDTAEMYGDGAAEESRLRPSRPRASGPKRPAV